MVRYSNKQPHIRIKDEPADYVFGRHSLRLKQLDQNRKLRYFARQMSKCKVKYYVETADPVGKQDESGSSGRQSSVSGREGLKRRAFRQAQQRLIMNRTDWPKPFIDTRPCTVMTNSALKLMYEDLPDTKTTVKPTLVPRVSLIKTEIPPKKENIAKKSIKKIKVERSDSPCHLKINPLSKVSPKKKLQGSKKRGNHTFGDFRDVFKRDVKVSDDKIARYSLDQCFENILAETKSLETNGDVPPSKTKLENGIGKPSKKKRSRMTRQSLALRKEEEQKQRKPDLAIKQEPMDEDEEVDMFAGENNFYNIKKSSSTRLTLKREFRHSSWEKKKKCFFF